MGGTDGISLPSTGYIFAIPQTYGVDSVAFVTGSEYEKIYGTIIGAQNGLDYWHVDIDPKEDSSDIFSITKEGLEVDSLKAEVFMNFNTDVTETANWTQLSGAVSYYAVSKYGIPNPEEITSLFVRIL